MFKKMFIKQTIQSIELTPEGQDMTQIQRAHPLTISGKRFDSGQSSGHLPSHPVPSSPPESQ